MAFKSLFFPKQHASPFFLRMPFGWVHVIFVAVDDALVVLEWFVNVVEMEF